MKSSFRLSAVFLVAFSGALFAQETPKKSETSTVTRCRASKLIGADLSNAAKENLGDIEDIVLDSGSRRIAYVVVSFGGFLGMGDKLFAIPWESLEFPNDGKNFVLNVDKDRLKNAEGFDKTHWPNFADEAWATKTYKYYDRTPYWQASDVDRKNDRTDGDYRTRWYERATIWQKSSDLTGKNIINMQNEDLGRISDLIIDPDGGRILYGVLASGGSRYAIPWSSLSLTNDGKSFQVDLTKDRLKGAPTFTDDKWPNGADERWATEVHRYYNVTPYWTVEVKRTTTEDPNRRP